MNQYNSIISTINLILTLGTQCISRGLPYSDHMDKIELNFRDTPLIFLELGKSDASCRSQLVPEMNRFQPTKARSSSPGSIVFTNN